MSLKSLFGKLNVLKNLNHEQKLFNLINSQYQVWLDKNKLPTGSLAEARAEGQNFKHQPTFSILVPTYETQFLTQTLSSIQNQTYQNLEVFVWDFTSSSNLEPIIKPFSQRLKIRIIKESLFKDLLSLAKGELIALIWSGDEISQNALYEVVKLLNQKASQVDLIYADEDKIDEKGERSEPFFKPDWSPDLLLSGMYLGRFVVYRKSILLKVRQLPEKIDKNTLWDLALKATEITKDIGHVPTVLYSNRKKGGYIAGWEEKNQKEISYGQEIIQNALKRRKLEGKVGPLDIPGVYQVSYKVKNEPLVSIIISTKDKAKLLSKCLNGILNNTRYTNFEILLIDNRSVEKNTFELFDRLKSNTKIRLLTYDKPFNIAAIYNWAAKQARGELLLFAGNDTEPISPDWLEKMVGYIQRDHIGAVGAKLLYPDKTIQHAGVVLGYGSQEDKSDRVAGHAFSHFPNTNGYFGFINITRNCSAVTGACFITKKELYFKVGGFNEKILKIRFNDVDYCLKLRSEGYYILYAPDCVLLHRESSSVGKINMDPHEIKYMREKWSFWEDNDPFYNPNLTLDRPDYTLRI